MTEPWFDGNLFGGIFGSVWGVVGGALGALTGILAPRGRARRIVLSLWWLMLSMSFLLLVVGLCALYVGQPRDVWYGFLLPGGLGIVLYGSLLPVVKKAYREAEQRRMISRDL